MLTLPYRPVFCLEVAPVFKQTTLMWLKNLYGRHAGYPAPPVQTRTCSFPASGASVVLASAVQSPACRPTRCDVALLYYEDVLA